MFKVFETKSEASEYLKTVYPDYFLTDVAVVVKVFDLMAQHYGCEPGYAISCEMQ